MRRAPSFTSLRALGALVVLPTILSGQATARQAGSSSARSTLASFATRLTVSADSAAGLLDFHTLQLQIATLEAIRDGEARGLPSSFETIGAQAMRAAREMPRLAGDFDMGEAPNGLQRAQQQLVAAIQHGATSADSLFAASVSCRRSLADVARCQLRFMKASTALGAAQREYAEARGRAAGLLKVQGYTLAERVTFEEHRKRAIAPKGGPRRYSASQLDSIQAKLEGSKPSAPRSP